MAKTPGEKTKKASVKKAAGKRAAKPSRPTLRGRMAGIRKELGAFGNSGGAGLFADTLEQLEALGREIAAATDRMMTACEAIQDAADGIGAKTGDRGTKMRLKKIARGTGDIFEACTFQDLTGQRLGKITRSVAALEDGVVEISALAGVKKGEKGKKKSAKSRNHSINKVDAGIVLEGPQIDGPAVSQDEIDKLFD